MAQYIDKASLIAEIERRRKKNARNKLNLAASFEDNYLLSFIDTLEVKDVDLDGISRHYALNNTTCDDCVNEIQDSNKVGFELGLKAKGEQSMTTDELLSKLPSHIGNCERDGLYVISKPEDDVKWLYLHNEGRYWLASYGIEGEFLCMNPNAKEPPYDNAFAYGDTPNEALQFLYNWCVEHGFIKEMEE